MADARASRKAVGGILRKDVPAGLVTSVASLPDGLASAALAGVNPLYGLYTSVVAPMSGSLLVSSQLMYVGTTSASALAAGQAIASYPESQRGQAMFLLVLLMGAMLALFGVLRLGRLSHYVSHSVMTGFLSGVAVVLVIDQFAPLVGYQPEGGNSLSQLADLLRNVQAFEPATMLVGVTALAILAIMRRSRFATIGSLAALAVPALAVVLLGLGRVELIEDVSVIPRGLPTPALPDISLLTGPLTGSAAAIATIIAIQGVGISQTMRNPDGSDSNASRDMIAQGAANAAASLFSGIPAGGSVGQTALNISSGAQSRWAGVIGGVWMLAIVLVFPALVGKVPMAVLTALMIMAGIGALDPAEIRSIWRTGRTALLPMLVTFAATLILWIPMAVAVGVLLTLLLFVISSANDVTIRAITIDQNGRMRESDPPVQLPSRETTVINVYGSLFFAGARRFETLLPDPAGSEHPAVVIRMRGRARLGATLIEVLDSYAEQLERVGGRLYLAGMGARAKRQLLRSGKLNTDRAVAILLAEDVLGASTARAMELANTWLGGDRPSEK